MKALFFLIATVLTGVIFFSCGQRNLAKRYANDSRGIYKLAIDPSSFTNVELHTFAVKTSAPPTIVYSVLSLSPQGQAELIKSIAAKSSTRKEIIEGLNTKFDFAKSGNNDLKIIPKTVKKSLVFTINRPYYLARNKSVTFNMMGDRIAFLELTVNIPRNQPISFDSWDRFVTDLTTLNLGKVTSAQQWSATLDVSATGTIQSSLSGTDTNVTGGTGEQNVVASATQTLPDGTSTNSNTNTTDQATSSSANKGKTTGSGASAQAGGSANLSFSDKYETSLDLANRIIKLSGTMAEKKIILRQESGPGIDLSGNVIVSVEYALEDDWATPVNFLKIKDLYDSAKKPIEPGHLNTSFLTVLFPDIRHDIVGTMDYSFLYRQVNRGNKHLPEARHKVTFWYGDVESKPIDSIPGPQQLILVKASDVRPKSYTLQHGKDQLTINGNVINFESPQEAVKLLKYLEDLLRAGHSTAAFQFTGVAVNAAMLSTIQVTTKNL